MFAFVALTIVHEHRGRFLFTPCADVVFALTQGFVSVAY